MGQTRAAYRLIVGHLDDGEVMVALSEREKGHLHLLKDVDQLHAEGLGVEFDRPLGVPHSQDNVSHFLDFRHGCPSLCGLPQAYSLSGRITRSVPADGERSTGFAKRSMVGLSGMTRGHAPRYAWGGQTGVIRSWDLSLSMISKIKKRRAIWSRTRRSRQ